MANYCCSNCFRDTEIKGYINTNSIIQGDCIFCEVTDTALIDTTELTDTFQNIIEVYTIDNANDGQTQSYLLHERIRMDWPNLFRITDSNRIKLLLEYICINEKYAKLLANPVKLNVIQDEDQEAYWDRFVEEIKFKNRFFIENIIDLELLKELFIRGSKDYIKGKLFYRARISPSKGYSKEEMGKPPYDKAVAGRANPKGISYLYISDNVITTFYETRSSLHDFVTVGEFKLLEDIKILNLRNTNFASPINLEDKLKEHLIHRQYLLRLESELSKPVRRQDSELDYLPTQYLCEFAKSLGFNGVEYRSSLNPDGFNLAIFDDSFFECSKVEVYEVKKLKYEYATLD